MQILWEDGYRKEMPWHTLKQYVIAICGGFRTTITDYLGKRAKYYKGRGREGILKTPGKQGYLERFGFIQKKTPKLVSLNHERVRRSYHYEQSNITKFSLSNSRREQGEREVTAFIEYDKNNNNTQKERENKSLHENVKEPTPKAEELRILRAATREGP